MTEVPQIVIPRPGEVRSYRTPDKRWEEVTKEIYGSADLPRTIRFAHDPYWDERFWSIQNVHDQGAWVVKKDFTGERKIGFWTFIGLSFWIGLWSF